MQDHTEQEGFIATAWRGGRSNQNTGSGYGLRISTADRDRYFREHWDTVTLHLDATGQSRVVKPTVSASFWHKCTELRNKDIGLWFTANGWAPWRRGKPPRFRLIPAGEGGFEVRRAD